MNTRIFRIVVFLMALLMSTGCINYSDGKRSGTLIKFSQKGLFCKTWEGTMNLGGIRKSDDGMVPNTWSFTIDPEVPADAELIPILDSALSSGQRVEVTYSQEYMTSPCRSDEDYFVKKVVFK